MIRRNKWKKGITQHNVCFVILRRLELLRHVVTAFYEGRSMRFKANGKLEKKQWSKCLFVFLVNQPDIHFSFCISFYHFCISIKYAFCLLLKHKFPKCSKAWKCDGSTLLIFIWICSRECLPLPLKIGPSTAFTPTTVVMTKVRVSMQHGYVRKWTVSMLSCQQSSGWHGMLLW